MATTLADIAQELGVSKMTISRAINNHPEINAETRNRVLEVARRLNYQPNQHARALATNPPIAVTFWPAPTMPITCEAVRTVGC